MVEPVESATRCVSPTPDVILFASTDNAYPAIDEYGRPLMTAAPTDEPLFVSVTWALEQTMLLTRVAL